MEWSVICQRIINTGIGLVKVSVCLCFLRIIDRPGVVLLIFSEVLTLFAALNHTAQVLLSIFQCRPMAAIWLPQMYLEAKCASNHTTYLVSYMGIGLDALTGPRLRCHTHRCDQPPTDEYT